MIPQRHLNSGSTVPADGDPAQQQTRYCACARSTEITTLRDADAFDTAIDTPATWPQEERREDPAG